MYVGTTRFVFIFCSKSLKLILQAFSHIFFPLRVNKVSRPHGEGLFYVKFPTQILTSFVLSTKSRVGLTNQKFQSRLVCFTMWILMVFVGYVLGESVEAISCFECNQFPKGSIHKPCGPFFGHFWTFLTINIILLYKASRPSEGFPQIKFLSFQGFQNLHIFLY